MVETVTLRVKSKKPSVKTAISRFDDWIKNTPCLDAKPHQREGVEWCLRKELSPNPVQNVRGGLIADEMGLGKTNMMIGVTISNTLTRTIVVLPLALLGQWDRNIRKMTTINPVIYHGPDRYLLSMDELKSAKIVLTTYDVLSGGGTALHTHFLFFGTHPKTWCIPINNKCAEFISFYLCKNYIYLTPAPI